MQATAVDASSQLCQAGSGLCWFFPKSLLPLAAQPVPPTLPVHKSRSLPGTAIHLLKDMKDASLTPVFLFSPPHPSFQPSKLNSQVIKKKADMGDTGGFILVLFAKLSLISEEFTQELVSQSLFYSFSGDLLCAGGAALTSSSRTFNFHFAPSSVPQRSATH